MTVDARIVLCTVPSDDVAVSIARALVEERLVACVNIIPGVRSIYRWQDQIEDERELMLVMKTQADRYSDIERRVRALHPHEVCEVIALDAVSVSAPYLAWLFAETSLT